MRQNRYEPSVEARRYRHIHGCSPAVAHSYFDFDERSHAEFNFLLFLGQPRIVNGARRKIDIVASTAVNASP